MVFKKFRTYVESPYNNIKSQYEFNAASLSSVLSMHVYLLFANITNELNF